jgi:hypothetical protein
MLPILAKSIKLSLQNYEKYKKIPLTPEGGTQKTWKGMMHFIFAGSTTIVLHVFLALKGLRYFIHCP